MKTKHLFFAVLLLIAAVLPTSFAQDNTQAGLPEGAIARIGKGGINIMRFSPDGMHLAVGTDIGVWLYDVIDGKATPFLSQPTKRTHLLAFSEDGRILATDGGDKSDIELWNIDVGKKNSQITLEEDRTGVSSFTFSEDRRILISLDSHGKVTHWNIDSGEKSSTLSEANISHYAHNLTLSEKGTLFAYSDSNGRIRIRDAKGGRRNSNLIGHGGLPRLLKRSDKRISVLAFSPNEKILASGGYDTTVRLWNTETWTNTAILKGHDWTVKAIAFSENGRMLASGDEGNTIKLWNIETRKEHATLEGHSSEICALTFSRDGNILASGSYDGTIRFWNPHTGKTISTFTSEHLGLVDTVDFFENTNTLLSVTNNLSVKVWEENTLKDILTFDGIKTSIVDVSLSLDDRHLAVIYHFPILGNNNLKVWNLITRNELKGPWSNVQDTVNAVTFSPNNHILVVSYRQEGVYLWHINAGLEIFHFDVKRHWNPKLTYSADGNILAHYGRDLETHLWNAKTMEEITQKNMKNIRSLAFSPDSKILAARINDEIILWDITLSGIKQRGRFINIKSNSYGNPRFSPDDLMFSPDGNILLVIMSNWGDYIQLWDIKTGWNLGKISGHTNDITTFDFSSDGKILATGSKDSTILLWDWEQTVSKLREANIEKNQDVFLLPPKDAVKYDNTAAEVEAVKNWLRISGYVIKKSYNVYSVRHHSSTYAFRDEVGSTYREGDLNLRVESEGIIQNRDVGSKEYVREGYEGVLQIRVEHVGSATFLVDEKGNLTHKKPDKADNIEEKR